MNLTKSILYATAGILFFAFTPFVYGQSKRDSTYQGTYFTDVRSDALGMNGVSLTYRPDNMYSNPAALSFLEQPLRLTFNHYYDASNSVQLQNITSIIFDNSSQAIALGLSYRYTGILNPEKTLGIFSASAVPYHIKQFDLTLGYSLKLSEGFSIGSLLQANYGGIDSKNKSTASVGFGLLYSPTPAIKYGVAFRGIGKNIDYTNLDYTFRKHVLSQSYGVTTAKRQHELSIGITMRYPYSPVVNQPYLTLTASNEKIFGVTGLWYNAGAELNIIKNIGIRGGYANSPNFKGFTAGIGLSFPFIQIDYAISPNPHTPYEFQQLAVSIKLDDL